MRLEVVLQFDIPETRVARAEVTMAARDGFPGLVKLVTERVSVEWEYDVVHVEVLP